MKDTEDKQTIDFVESAKKEIEHRVRAVFYSNNLGAAICQFK